MIDEARKQKVFLHGGSLATFSANLQKDKKDSLYLNQIFLSMKKKYKWGILAPGKMSAKFTRGLKLLDNAELYAVGSRDIDRARQFADEFGFKKSYGSYEELAS